MLSAVVSMALALGLLSAVVSMALALGMLSVVVSMALALGMLSAVVHCPARSQDFEKAGQLRDREMELKTKIQAIIAGAKETSKAEAESVEGGGPW